MFNDTIKDILESINSGSTYNVNVVVGSVNIETKVWDLAYITTEHIDMKDLENWKKVYTLEDWVTISFGGRTIPYLTRRRRTVDTGKYLFFIPVDSNWSEVFPTEANHKKRLTIDNIDNFLDYCDSLDPRLDFTPGVSKDNVSQMSEIDRLF